MATSLPSLTTAATGFREAAVELEKSRVAAANEQQHAALRALDEGLELFLDLRRLIERVYADERQIRDALTIEVAEAERGPLLQTCTELTEKNVQRAARLDILLDEEIEKLSDDAEPQAATQDSVDPAQRFEIAKQLLVEVNQGFDAQRLGLTAMQKDESEAERRAEVLSSVDMAIDKVEALRRLFFSLVEHLRDAGRQQAQLNDETNELAGQPDRQSPETIAPLGSRQQQLQQLTSQLADAFQEQANQQAAAPGDASSSPVAATAGDAAERFRDAGKLVDDSQYEMQRAAQSIAELAEAEPRDFAESRLRQGKALELIGEALELLDDSPPQQQPPDQSDQQQQEQNEEEQENQQQQQQQQQQEQQEMDANQLLQLIRDREAQRRRDKQKSARRAVGGVDKDW